MRKTAFSQFLLKEAGETKVVTKVGYMPIIQAPAHEMDTPNTVVRKCMRVAAALGQQHTVITVDQAHYSELVELKWAFPEYQKKLAVQLGGLRQSYERVGISGFVGEGSSARTKCSREYDGRESIKKSNACAQDESPSIMAFAHAVIL